jgi:sialic acid synthase SpsE
MNNTTIIFDGGSCHEGDFNNAIRLAYAAKDANADAIKFQFLPEQLCRNGNIAFPNGCIGYILKWCDNFKIGCFFSVWNIDDASFLLQKMKKTEQLLAVKIAHHKTLNYGLIEFCCRNFDVVYLTLDSMQVCPEYHNITTLWTHTIHGETVYPVESILSFEGTFPRFEGFSDHTLGINQSLNAIAAGAKVIEKHLCINNSQKVPDARFALPIKDAQNFVKLCRGNT